MRRYLMIAIAAMMSTAAGAQAPRMPPAPSSAAQVQPMANPDEQVDRTLGTLYRQNLNLQYQLQAAQRELADLKAQLAKAAPVTPAPDASAEHKP